MCDSSYKFQKKHQKNRHASTEVEAPMIRDRSVVCPTHAPGQDKTCKKRNSKASSARPFPLEEVHRQSKIANIQKKKKIPRNAHKKQDTKT